MIFTSRMRTFGSTSRMTPLEVVDLGDALFLVQCGDEPNMPSDEDVNQMDGKFINVTNKIGGSRNNYIYIYIYMNSIETIWY